MKDKVIIWGGNKKPLNLENLDSHASVSAFFLTKYLSKYYEIINLLDMDCPEEILQYKDVIAVISTFQKGFTNRIILKGKEKLFYTIRKHIKGKLCSIYDYNDDGKYYEDIIFTVRQPNLKNINRIRKKSYNPDIIFSWMGWCAEPDLCHPEKVSKNEVNIFIDHPPYNLKAPDCTGEYYKAFKEIKHNNQKLKLNVYQQNNSGIIELDLNNNDILEKTLYVRKNKVPWAEIIKYYRKMHVFCLTHPESAGLSAIEAGMCGAKLYIPKYRINRLFIGGDLLSNNIPNSIFRCSSGRILQTFIKDMGKGFERKKNHQNISKSNSWKLAAERVHKELTKCLKS